MSPHFTALVRSRPALVAGVVAVAAIAIGAVIAFAVGFEGEPVAVASPTLRPTPTLSPSASPTASPTSTPSPTPTPTPTPVARCEFDGEELTADGMDPPVLVSIDNHPQARPATGLQAADIVFENPVQGNMTRFVALFACDTPDVVGPVRSGRWIQSDLWRQLEILPIIYGAAGYTTSYFAAEGMPHIDGNVESWPFFSRSSARIAPYNVYMNVELLQELLQSNADLVGRVERAGEPRAILEFDPDWTAPDDAREVTSIDIRTAPSWGFGWRYDADEGVYERVDSGSVTNDAATREPLNRRTIIVQRAVSERPFADPRPGADPPIQRLVGTGTGTVYVDGIAFDVEWSRASAENVTEWTVVSTDDPLVLPPGPIWWEILPLESPLTES